MSSLNFMENVRYRHLEVKESQKYISEQKVRHNEHGIILKVITFKNRNSTFRNLQGKIANWRMLGDSSLFWRWDSQKGQGTRNNRTKAWRWPHLGYGMAPKSTQAGLSRILACGKDVDNVKAVVLFTPWNVYIARTMLTNTSLLRGTT